VNERRQRECKLSITCIILRLLVLSRDLLFFKFSLLEARRKNNTMVRFNQFIRPIDGPQRCLPIANGHGMVHDNM